MGPLKLERQKVLLIGGILLALSAAGLAKIWLDQQRQQAIRSAQNQLKELRANQTPVLIAKVDIPSGATIDADKFEPRIIPNQYVAPQAVTSADRIAGMVTIAPIPKDEQITLSKLSYPGGQAGGLAAATPVGKRAITISADNLASLGGMIRPGDYVDVIAIIAVPMQGADGRQAMETRVIPLFENVSVLAVGQQIGMMARSQSRYSAAPEEQQKDVPLITLALGPHEASLISFVQEQGKIRLAMRNPADTKIADAVQTAGWETLFGYIMPMPQKSETQKEEPSSYVEIYRGLNKERIPLQK